MDEGAEPGLLDGLGRKVNCSLDRWMDEGTEPGLSDGRGRKGNCSLDRWMDEGVEGLRIALLAKRGLSLSADISGHQQLYLECSKMDDVPFSSMVWTAHPRACSSSQSARRQGCLWYETRRSPIVLLRGQSMQVGGI